MDMPIQVPTDNPKEDTEWNDILRQHGIIPEKPPSPSAEMEKALTQARELAHENRLEGKDLDELDELEDEEDEQFLEGYRQQRIRQLNDLAKASIHGSVYHLQKPEYNNAVTETSQKVPVLVLLTSSTSVSTSATPHSTDSNSTQSALAERIWNDLAKKFADIKFCQMRADLCIEGYPERNTPTILIYKGGDIIKQIVTLAELGGMKAEERTFEKMLVDAGVVGIGDMRMRRKDDEDENDEVGGKKSLRVGRNGQSNNEDADSDWD